MRIVQFLLLLTSLLILSCTKDEFTEGHSIIEISKSKPIDIQELVRSRLLFAKIVSIAFGNREFRQYFKTNFGTKSKNGNYFEECLLIAHLDDKVLADGSTLKVYLNSIRDFELSNIIHESIIDFVLKNDKMVSIKLPDLFVDFTWNIDEILPVVIATYPEQYSNVNFIGYHYCNDSEFYLTGDVPQVFHVYIKHSEDYVLVNETDFDDNFEYLPQLIKCEVSIGKIISQSAIYQGKRIVNLKSAYNICIRPMNYIF